MPASVIGPVRGPRSASTSLSARVAGRRRAARECVPRAEGELACVSLRRGFAISSLTVCQYRIYAYRTSASVRSDEMDGSSF